MDAAGIFGLISQYLVSIVVAGGGLAAISYALFRFLGSRWLEAKFAERLQNLKSEQDQAIRYVQSTIDREIHRAKKLYDSEFTALSECWRLLREVYDQSAGTIASFTANVERLTDEELERFLTKLGMDEWQQNEIRTKNGQDRQVAYRKWSEWERFKRIDGLWRTFRSYLDANSIFFADGFTEKFRALDQLIVASNVEFESRVRYDGTDHGRAYSFDSTIRLRNEGEPKMKELEEMVRKRLWSVAKDAEARPTANS